MPKKATLSSFLPATKSHVVINAALEYSSSCTKVVVDVVCGILVKFCTCSGAVIGEALSSHPLVRKVGFTGSTPVGKTIMQRCAELNYLYMIHVYYLFG